MARLREEIRQHKPFASLEEEALLNLMRTYDRLFGALARFFKRHGISEPQYNVLRILRGAGPAGLPSLEIAARLLSRTPDITRLVDRLERAGFVRRKRNRGDRRVIRVHLTTEGSRFLARLDEPIDRFQRDLLGHLPRKDLRELVRLLEKSREGRLPEP